MLLTTDLLSYQEGKEKTALQGKVCNTQGKHNTQAGPPFSILLFPPKVKKVHAEGPLQGTRVSDRLRARRWKRCRKREEEDEKEKGSVGKFALTLEYGRGNEAVCVGVMQAGMKSVVQVALQLGVLRVPDARALSFASGRTAGIVQFRFR